MNGRFTFGWLRIGGAGAFALALLISPALFGSSAQAAKKAAPKKAVKTAKPAKGLLHPVSRSPTVDVKNVVEIARDQVSDEGVWVGQFGGRGQAIRLPAALDFREGNLFSADGRWIRVNHLSQNTREPAFKLGRRERFFHDNGLYPQETSLLEYARLYLFPKSGAQSVKASVETWIEDLDSFLSLHRHDSLVIREIESFVLKFSNQPPRGYLPGDQLWDTRRRFSTWIQFFESPLQYDLSGMALTVDGRPLDRIPTVVSKERVSSLPRLYPNVIRNLEYTFEALRTVMYEGPDYHGDDSLAEITAIRRSYLTLKLIKTGHALWERMNENAK